MKKHLAYIIVGLLLLLTSRICLAVEAVNLDMASKQRQFLLLQQKSLNLQLEQLSQDIELDAASIKQSLLLLNRKLAENDHAAHILEQQEQMLERELLILKKHIESPTTLNKEPYKQSYDQIQSHLQSISTQLTLFETNNAIIQKIQKKLEIKRAVINKNQQLLDQKKSVSRNQQKIEALAKQIDAILLKKITLAQQASLSDEQYQQTAIELFSVEQNAKQLLIEYLSLENKFIGFSEQVPLTSTLPVINQHLSDLKAHKISFEKIHDLIARNSEQLDLVIKRIKGLTVNGSLTATTISRLLKRANRLQTFNQDSQKQVIVTLQQIKDDIAQTEHERAKKVSTRQTILSYDSDELLHVAKDMLRLPAKFMLYLQSLYGSVELSFSLLTVYQQLLTLLAIALIFSLWLVGHAGLNVRAHSDSLPLGKNLYIGLLRILNRNFGSICIFSSLLLIFYACHISYSSIRLIVLLFIAWFCFRGLLSITRLILIENESQIDGNDVALFYRLRVAFITGGLVTTLMILTHELNLPSSAYFFSQLFMLFLFSVAIVLLRARDTLYVLLKSIFHVKRLYLKRALQLLLVLSPLALMINALVGLSGFSLLAWEVSYYLLIVVLSVSAYVIVRGVVNDLLDIIANFLIAHSKNGWFWGEAFLKPINSLINALLLVGLVLVLFFLFGLSKQERVLNFVVSLWHFQLFRYSKADITIGSFIEFSFLVMVFVWLTRWSRECCYRWIYQYVKDQGIRNSLSVFTQYAVVTLGFIITLRVLGVDISGVSMILGGLAVGMGFGLRDFANNIVGGLMLLIERPVKEGDLISIDNTEGRVIHIGIRSMRIRSWDHLEVLIPNSETFSKPFTNWTHQDSVVRTVITIKVSREDSATKVQDLILEVLDIIPEVLKDPAPQVYLKHIDEALLEFEVRYFINIENNSRMNVRSIVLFAITAQFKAAGIKAPIPPLSIESLKSCPS